jgi:O-antigen ligase
MLIAYNVVEGKRDIRGLIWAYVLGIIISGFIIYSKSWTFVISDRLAGIYENPNVLSNVCLFGIFSVIILIKSKVNYLGKYEYIPILVLMSFLVLVSKSRKAILILLIMAIIFSARHVFNEKNLKGAFKSIVLLVSGSFFIYFYSLIGDVSRVKDVTKVFSFSFRNADTVIRRFHYADAAWSVFMDNPLFGVGANQFRDYVQDYYPYLFTAYAHNNYLEILASYGIGGFLIFYSVYIALFRRALSLGYPLESRSFVFSIAISILLILILDLFTVTYYRQFYGLFMSLVLCAVNNEHTQRG